MQRSSRTRIVEPSEVLAIVQEVLRVAPNSMNKSSGGRGRRVTRQGAVWNYDFVTFDHVKSNLGSPHSTTALRKAFLDWSKSNSAKWWAMQKDLEEGKSAEEVFAKHAGEGDEGSVSLS